MASLRASENIQTPYHDWQGPPWSGRAPFPALFCTALPQFILLWPHSPSLVPWTGSAHSHFPTFALARSSHASSTLSLRSQFICHLLRETVPDHPPWKPLSRHFCLTMVSLFFIVPSIHIWNDLFYLLAGSLIRIWTSRQQGLFCLSLYPNLAHDRYSTNICLLIHLSFRIKECYSRRGPGKPCTQVPPAIDEEVRDGQVTQSRSMVGGLNCPAGIPMGSGPRLMPQEEITYHANIWQTLSRRASSWDLKGH